MTTKAEADHLNRLQRLGCIVCKRLDLGHTEPEIHHPRYLAGMGQKASHMDAIPLCPRHHRSGGFGVALHDGQRTWEKKYGTEAELLAQVKELLGINQQGEAV